MWTGTLYMDDGSVDDANNIDFTYPEHRLHLDSRPNQLIPI